MPLCKLLQMLFGTRQDINSINKIYPLTNKTFLGQSLNITYIKRSGSPPSLETLPYTVLHSLKVTEF